MEVPEILVRTPSKRILRQVFGHAHIPKLQMASLESAVFLLLANLEINTLPVRGSSGLYKCLDAYFAGNRVKTDLLSCGPASGDKEILAFMMDELVMLGFCNHMEFAIQSTRNLNDSAVNLALSESTMLSVPISRSGGVITHLTECLGKDRFSHVSKYLCMYFDRLQDDCTIVLPNDFDIGFACTNGAIKNCPTYYTLHGFVTRSAAGQVICYTRNRGSKMFYRCEDAKVEPFPDMGQTSINSRGVICAFYGQNK
ncbi:MAG: hypothetical protein SGCHY_003939 [Lobulomycetales sp.]